MKNLTDKPSRELEEYQQSLKRDFELVKRELYLKTKHLEKIKSEYIKVSEELKLRYGIR
jgi:uncharacterized protein YueI